MWDLSSLTRGQTHVPCITRCILNRWTTREVLEGLFLFYVSFFCQHTWEDMALQVASKQRPGSWWGV